MWVGKVWCGSDCTGRGIMMKRMMIHIRFVRVRVRGLLQSPGKCFWLTGYTLKVSDEGGTFNGNKITVKSKISLLTSLCWLRSECAILTTGGWNLITGHVTPLVTPPWALTTSNKYRKQISVKNHWQHKPLEQQHRCRSRQFITFLGPGTLSIWSKSLEVIRAGYNFSINQDQEQTEGGLRLLPRAGQGWTPPVCWGGTSQLFTKLTAESINLMDIISYHQQSLADTIKILDHVKRKLALVFWFINSKYLCN